MDRLAPPIVNAPLTPLNLVQVTISSPIVLGWPMAQVGCRSRAHRDVSSPRCRGGAADRIENSTDLRHAPGGTR